VGAVALVSGLALLLVGASKLTVVPVIAGKK